MLKFFILVSFLTRTSFAGEEKIGIRVIGGEQAFKNQFPWIVNLRRIATHNENTQSVSVPFCGAVIISEDWLLTAAHCMVIIPNENKPISEILLTAGDHSLHIEEKSEQRRKISKSIIHDLFKPSSKIDHSYDFALVKVSESFLYSESVKAVTFPENSFTEENSRKIFTVAGWGLNSTLYSEPHDILQKAELQIVDKEICAKDYENDTMIGESMICAVQGFKSPCDGDSGSGLVEIIEDAETLIKTHVLHGIVSFGPESCNEDAYISPAVFGNVSFISDWINFHVHGTVVTTSTVSPCKQTDSETRTTPTSTSSHRSVLVGLLFICNCFLIPRL